jgi:hypothetical protein
MKGMNIISKETLIGAAALGAGAVAAKVVQSKVVPMVLPKATILQKNIATLVAGIFTPSLIKGPIGMGLGAGMVAASVAGLVDPYLVDAGLLGMGDVLLGSNYGYGADDDGGGTLMGATDTFSTVPNDYSAQGAEMDY